jgi:outer membrane protein TolC
MGTPANLTGARPKLPGIRGKKSALSLILVDFRRFAGIQMTPRSSEKMMDVRGSIPHVFRRLGAPVFCALGALALAVSPGHAQSRNPSSASNPYFGSVTAHPVTDETIKLSLDDAVRRGLENNLGLKEAENGEKTIQGEKNQALQEFLPTITLSGGTGYFEHDLASLGFGPTTIDEFTGLFPPGQPPPTFPAVTKNSLTEGMLNYHQTLFSGPVIAGWKAAGAAQRAAHFARMSARGEVVQQVATAYLKALAAESEVDDATALAKTDQLLYDQARAAHEAGTLANLDELRARVQLQSQQQVVIAAQNALDKALILLKREIGIDPGQNVVLTDPAPYSELAEQTPDEVRSEAYRNRQDYQNLQNQVAEYKAIHSAYRSERLPSLSFNGYWGTQTVNGAGTHGVFAAIGTLSVPLFREPGLRGDIDASAAQLATVNAQLSDLRGHIDEQVRDALLDVDATSNLVAVARSNVDLATQALSDETDRFNAGVDDNLPLVTAQSTLAHAQTNLVESLYQYNLSKLQLARAAGVLEQQYRVYLGR